MFRSQKPQPKILSRTYGQAYTASPECILDIPRPKKDISDVFYSNGQSKPEYYQILDKFTRKRVFSDAWTQVSFDKAEKRDLKKECNERKNLVQQLYCSLDSLEGVRSLAKDISFGLREISIAARTVNVALGSIKPEHIPDGQCLNLSMNLELPGRIAKHLAHIDGIIRRADMVLDKREQFLEINEDVTSKFTKEIVDLFVDDEVDIEGLHETEVISFSLRREHIVTNGGGVGTMGGGRPNVEGAILEGGPESISSPKSGNTEDSQSTSPSRRKKKSPLKKSAPPQWEARGRDDPN
jgi:hypothetical protein